MSSENRFRSIPVTLSPDSREDWICVRIAFPSSCLPSRLASCVFWLTSSSV